MIMIMMVRKSHGLLNYTRKHCQVCHISLRFCGTFTRRSNIRTSGESSGSINKVNKKKRREYVVNNCAIRVVASNQCNAVPSGEVVDS